MTDEVSSYLERFHNEIEYLFESCITNKLRVLMDEE